MSYCETWFSNRSNGSEELCSFWGKLIGILAWGDKGDGLMGKRVAEVEKETDPIVSFWIFWVQLIRTLRVLKKNVVVWKFSCL